MEQGQAVVLSSIFSPPARVGVGAWWRSLVFPLLWGATTPARQTTLRSGVGAACGRSYPITQRGDIKKAAPGFYRARPHTLFYSFTK